MPWTESELAAVGEAEELEISSLRADGTPSKYVPIWMVRVGDAIYVRSVNGRDSGWFRGVLKQHLGSIKAGGVTKRVHFVEIPAADAVNADIDATYLTKYARYPQYVAPLFLPPAMEATLRLDAREE